MAPSKPTSLSRTCLCAPTTHPGSFRCSLHRKGRGPAGRSSSTAGSGSAGRVEPKGSGGSNNNKARSIRAVLMQLIKPSSHDLCRRRNFQPKPSRFCVVNGSGQGVAVV